MIKLYCFKAKNAPSDLPEFEDQLLNQLVSASSEESDWDELFDFEEPPVVLGISVNAVERCERLDSVNGTVFTLVSGNTMACTMEFDKFIETFE